MYRKNSKTSTIEKFLRSQREKKVSAEEIARHLDQLVEESKKQIKILTTFKHG